MRPIRSERQLGATTGGGIVRCYDNLYYIVDMQGYFHAEHLQQALRMIRDDKLGHVSAVVFVEGDELQSYDKSVLTYYEELERGA